MMYWVNASVINKAKIALQYTDKPIIDISQELHFNEQTSFTRFFKHLTGMAPTEYRIR
jgi:AraC family transcriptional activator of pobA